VVEEMELLLEEPLVILILAVQAVAVATLEGINLEDQVVVVLLL
jgi:hypothetical protein